MGQRALKTVTKSVCCPLCQLRKKVSYAKGNLFLQILEYSTRRPKFQTQILISNFVGAKFSRWHLGITSFLRQIGSSLGLDIPRDSFGGFLFDFPCWVLLCLYFLGELHQSPKVQDCLRSPHPSRQLRIYIRLNTRLRVG